MNQTQPLFNYQQKPKKVKFKTNHSREKSKELRKELLLWLYSNRSYEFRSQNIADKTNELKINRNIFTYLVIANILVKNPNGNYNWNPEYATPNLSRLLNDLLAAEKQRYTKQKESRKKKQIIEFNNENVKYQFQKRTYYSLQKKMKYIEWVINNKNTFFAYDEFRAKCSEIGISTTYCDILYKYGLLKKGEKMTFTFNENFKLKDIFSMAVDTYEMEREMRINWTSEKKRKEKVKTRKIMPVQPLTIIEKETPKKSIIPLMTLIAIVILSIILIVKL